MTDEEKLENRRRIGAQIAEIRKSKNISLTRLSEMTGLDRVNINKVELGKYNVSVDIINRICKALEVELIIS